MKRKSGFLVPYYGSSNNFGSWINIPYFKTLGKDKDMTFNPRFYADDKFILQSECRQSYKNSDLISDFSYNNDGKNSNTHLFANLSGKIDQSTKIKFLHRHKQLVQSSCHRSISFSCSCIRVSRAPGSFVDALALGK